ncbi:MAG: aminotransferase class IV [Bacteroidales bacterium]|jgi:branched-chain amino acid aminotransferase|nr:aminotransferase class IV [Bacteroidales bacterium]
MGECYGSCFIRNGEIVPGVLFNNSDVYEGDSVYEVLRMMGGVPLFFTDHMERLENSVKYHGRTMPVSAGKIAADLIVLRKEAGVRDVNLKIVFNYKESGVTCLLYFIEPLYPTRQQYREGVDTILYDAERENPEVKIINHRLRSSIYHRLIATGAYEALLVDSDGNITEGSRSNVFFIRSGRLFTAPDEKVLGGITRKHVLEICSRNSIPVEFSCVHSGKMADYESLFMTGTSPMVLPIRRVDEHEFSVVNSLMVRLMKHYHDRVSESISSFRRPD